MFVTALLADGNLSDQWWWLLLFVPVATLAWWVMGELDDARIRKYGEARGWRFEGIELLNSGSSRDDARYYAVRYVDDRGRLRSARCRTGLGSGVYFTDECDLGPAPQTSLAGRAADCRRCGAQVDEALSACSYCGTPRRSG